MINNNKIYENMQCVAGVYQITNMVNGKTYIGSSINCKQRIITHIHMLRRNKHANTHLQFSYNKHGESSFKMEMLCCVLDNTKLMDVEQYFLDLYNVCDRSLGYNISPTAKSTLGIKHSSQACAKKSRMAMHEKNHFYGKHHSEETRKILREKTIERFKTTTNPFLGKKHTQESKKKARVTKATEQFRCNETGDVFCTTGDAGEKLGVKPGYIGQTVFGRTNIAGGYTFSKIDGTPLGKPPRARLLSYIQLRALKEEL